MKRLNPSAARRRLRDEEGLSLLEVMVAMFVLAVSVLALASVASASLISLRATRDREQATNAASAVIEAIRAGTFRATGLASGAADTTCFEGEPVVVTPEPDPVPFQQTSGVNDNITVTTYVTWFQEDRDPANTTCADTDARLSKRITAIARWSDRGGAPREVRQSTVVANVGRGLPVPEFEVNPDDATLVPVQFDPTQVGTDGVERCVSHTLRNRGAEDSYDWNPSRAVGGGGNTVEFQKVDSARFRTQGGRWEVRAYFEFNEDDETSRLTNPIQNPAGFVGDHLPYFQLMTDTTNDAFAETTKRVPPGATARMWFCYRAISATVGQTLDVTVTVRSRFDSNRTETARHFLEVRERGLTLFLFDPDDSQAHPRTCGAAYPMGPVTGLQPAVLGQTVFDWSTNLTPSLPGVRLPRGNSSCDLLWHRQFTSDTRIKSNPDADEATILTFWAGTDASLADPALFVAAGQPVTLRFQAQLERLRRNENSFNPTPHILWNQTLDVVVDPAQVNELGWVQFQRQIPAGEWSELNPLIDGNRFLRLRLHCRSDGPVDCHVAYDNLDMPSRIVLVVF